MTRGRVRIFVPYEDLGRALGLPAGVEVARTHESRDGAHVEVTVAGELLPVPERGLFPVAARLTEGALSWNGGGFPITPTPRDVETPEPQATGPIGIVGEVRG